jgi:hypothetical protein
MYPLAAAGNPSVKPLSQEIIDMRRTRGALATIALIAVGLSCAEGRPEAADNKDAIAKDASPLGSSTGNSLAAGREVTGALESTDPLLGDGSHVDVWTYEGTAGEVVTVKMGSTEFDTYLLFGRVVNGEFDLIDSDDDGGEVFLNSQLEAELPASGTYAVFANSASPGATGTYTLLVESNAAAVYTERFPDNGDPSGRYALIVGISDYPGEEDDLATPVPDAEIMRDVLINRYNFPAENIVMLLDDDATRGAIMSAFKRHLGQAGSDGVAVFYYSGHGMQLPRNVGYQDNEEDGRDESIFVYGPADYSSVIVDDELGELADGLNTDNVLLILDSCHSGTGTRGPDAMPKLVDFDDVKDRVRLPVDILGSERGAVDDKGYGDALADPARHILLAGSASDEVSWAPRSVWPQRGSVASVFTHFLANVMNSSDPDASFVDIMQTVREQTVSWTVARDYTAQTPQLEGQRARLSVRAFLMRN